MFTSWEPNWLALVISLILSVGLGSLWYSPLLFGKAWMKAMGITQENLKEKTERSKISLVKSALFMFVLLIGYDLLYDALIIDEFQMAILLSLILWAGFAIQGHVKALLWEGKSMVVFLIGIAYELAVLEMVAVVFFLLG